jgi:hypothetical protein
MNNRGQVLLNDIPDTISYDMKQYTKETALLDFANTRAISLLIRHGYIIYKQIDL